MTNEELNDLDARALRMLDGMSVNREKLARDVMRLTAETRRRMAPPQPEPRKQGPFTGAFEGVFDDVFKRGSK